MESEVNRNIEEQLSAFLDGELSADELQLLVRRIERDDEYRATLARYARIGGLLRNDRLQHLPDQLRSNLIVELEDAGGEKAAQATPEQSVSKASWFKPSIAAAVSALALATLLTTFYAGPSGVAPSAPIQQAAIRDRFAEVSPQGSARQVAITPQLDSQSTMDSDRMLSYLVSHGEYARSFQGSMMDTRVFVQQASFEE